jgi:hypothetical protein
MKFRHYYSPSATCARLVVEASGWIPVERGLDVDVDFVVELGAGTFGVEDRRSAPCMSDDVLPYKNISMQCPRATRAKRPGFNAEVWRL